MGHRLPSFSIAYQAYSIFQIGLHSILSFTHEEYGRATSISRLTGWTTTNPYTEEDIAAYPTSPAPASAPQAYNVTRRANATLLMLARNSDIEGAMRSVRELEDRFNRKFGYPWTFLNEEPFSEEFKRCVVSRAAGRSQSVCPAV